MVVLLCVFISGTDSMVNRDLAQGAWLMMGGVVGSYVFGAIWDDKIKGNEALGMHRQRPDGDRP